MASEKRLIDANALYIRIAKLTMYVVGVRYGKSFMSRFLEGFRDEILKAIEDAPTVDAVEVDVVAQMLYDAFGDGCPCNYNGNDEWLPFVCDDGNLCIKHDDPLYCWKQYIKHYEERKGDGNV